MNENDALVRGWLFFVAGLVFAMVIVGGATRLTDSGLSITEWLPILGAIPPLSAADWAEAFAKYRLIPEYELVNKGMSLDDFKFIYWWEWSHRFLGRFIGVAFALPFLFFWASGRLREGLPVKLFGLLVLGGLQGGVGWYMVQSGLSERVDVSHYRLALHLSIAFAIFGLILWTALGLGATRNDTVLQSVSPMQQHLAAILVGGVLFQVVVGAFVAGLKAGLAHTTWPLMDGQIIPDGLFDLSPWYVNFLESMTMVQFVHRAIAYLIVGVALAHWLGLRSSAQDRRIVWSAGWFVLTVLVQVSLGVATLLSVPDAGGIPIGLGLAHQGWAVVVFGVSVWHLRRMYGWAR